MKTNFLAVLVSGFESYAGTAVVFTQVKIESTLCQELQVLSFSLQRPAPTHLTDKSLWQHLLADHFAVLPKTTGKVELHLVIIFSTGLSCRSGDDYRRYACLKQYHGKRWNKHTLALHWNTTQTRPMQILQLTWQIRFPLNARCESISSSKLRLLCIHLLR